MNINGIMNLDKSFGVQNYGRKPVAFVRGEGCTLFDTEGKQYTDFFAGVAVNSLGYAHPELTRTLAEQAGMITHSSNWFYIEQQAKLSAELVKHAPGFRSFFCNSGAEANECAVKLALKYFYDKGEARSEIISATNSFHGRTLAALALTGQQNYHPPFASLLPRVTYVPYNDTQALSDAISTKTATVILETIQGEGGVIVADAAYIQAARQLCDQTGTLLIIDEVQTGIGRTGTLFSFEQFDVVPDIFTLAKGLGGGVPIGATLAKDEIAQCFKPGDHGSTFGGNALACAAALCVTDIVSKQAFLADVQAKGEYLLTQLQEIKQHKNTIADVRGKGLLIGIEFAASVKVDDVLLKLLDAGFVAVTAKHNTLRLMPPLVITVSEIDKLLTHLNDVVD